MLTSLIWHRSDAEANTVLAASASGYSDFFEPNFTSAAWEDYNEWDFTFPSGYYLTTCGG